MYSIFGSMNPLSCNNSVLSNTLQAVDNSGGISILSNGVGNKGGNIQVCIVHTLIQLLILSHRSFPLEERLYQEIYDIPYWDLVEHHE